MIGIHCFLPKCDSDNVFTMTHTNVLTWAMSIVSYKRVYGDIMLVTNERGKKVVNTLGLLPAYNGNIKMDLQDMDVPHPKKFHRTFWAGSKLFALKSIDQTPCCMVDLDAVIWSPLPNLSSACTFLHQDYNVWECYKNNKKHFLKYLPSQFDNNGIWEINAANTAIMAFYDKEFKQLYENHAIEFMLEYSKRTKLKNKDKSEMVFAEQRMLSLCAGLYNKKISPVSVLKGTHLATNPYVTHLWNSKSYLSEMWQANKRYSKWAIKYLRKHAPELEQVCIESEKIIRNVERTNMDLIKGAEDAFRYKANVIEIKSINGDFRVKDPNIPLLYKTNEDHLGFLWEELYLVSGSADVYKNGKFQNTIIKNTPTSITYGNSEEEVKDWNKLISLIGDI